MVIFAEAIYSTQISGPNFSASFDKRHKTVMADPHLTPLQLNSEIATRVSNLQKKMRTYSQGLDAVLVSGNVNLYYVTGRFFRGYAYVPIFGEPIYFVVRPQIFHKEKNVIYIRKPEQIPEILASLGFLSPRKIGMENDVLTVSEYERLAKVFPEPEKINVSPLLRETRMVKTPYEINQMRIDGDHQVRVYEKISGLYREGMTDIELQIAIEGELRKEGCLGFARVAGNLMDINMGSVLAGANADNPSPYEFSMGGEGADPSLPGGANGTEIRRGETVMVDMNGSFNAYQTDMTRVWSLGGLSKIAMLAHKCSIEILRTLEELARPGLPVSDLYMKAEEIARQWDLADYFMGHRQKAGFIGHGVGLELNEQPAITARNKTLLEENMTIAIEPKFVLPDVGAVGVENTYIVTARGLENLTVFNEEIMPFKAD